MWPRRIVLDSLGEYEREFPGAEKVHSFQDFGEKMKHYWENGAREFVLIYRFNPENSLSESEFDQIMRVAYYFGNVQVVIEEVQLYSSPNFLPHWLKQCLLTGRHKGVSLLFTTQRPGELNKTILSQCHHIFCGQIIEGNDVNYLKSFLQGQHVRLPQLPKRRFLWFSDDGVSEISNEF